jgi:hypothetical protein
MDIAWVLPLITVALSFIGAGAGAYLGGYLRAKGENLATHEDIDWLKEKVSAVTETTKKIETEISDAAWNRQKRWELKREVLFEATKRLAEIDEACTGLQTSLQARRKLGDVRSGSGISGEWLEKWNHATTGFDDARLRVAIVCGGETNEAFFEYGLAASLIVGAVLREEDADAEVLAKSAKELAMRLSAVRAAVRKELEIDAW